MAERALRADDAMSPELRENVSLLRASAQTLLLLANNVLDVSALSAGSLVLRDTVFKFGECAALHRVLRSESKLAPAAGRWTTRWMRRASRR
jgi:two-component system sensor histidine kinase RpfC